VNRLFRTTLILAGALLAGAAALQTTATAEEPAAPAPGPAEKAPAGMAEHGGAALVERLQALRPNIRVLRVSPTPVPGVVGLEVTGGTILYGTTDGRYLFAGDLYDLTGADLVDVAEEGRAEKRRALLATVDSDSMVIFKAKGETRAVINVFTDVDCGYCQKLHLEVPQLNAMGIEVRYLGYPRAGIGSESYDRIVSAWCAKDPNDALTRIKAGQNIPAATCDNQIAAHYGLAREMGVAGTPAIVLQDGSMLPGYMPAAEIAKAVGI
jgi:thiol:disulfide interchange protein DsbC